MYDCEGSLELINRFFSINFGYLMTKLTVQPAVSVQLKLRVRIKLLFPRSPIPFFFTFDYFTAIISDWLAKPIVESICKKRMQLRNKLFHSKGWQLEQIHLYSSYGYSNSPMKVERKFLKTYPRPSGKILLIWCRYGIVEIRCKSR